MTTENVQTSAQPGAATGPLTSEQASAQLEQLRADRLAGKVLQDDYLARADYLGRIAVGESAAQVAPPASAPATSEERFAQQYDEAMKPPTELHEYGSLPTMSTDSALAQHLDTAVRTAFVKAGIPKHLASPLVDAANRISLEIYPEGRRVSQQEAAEKIGLTLRSTGNALRDRWGDQYQARFDGVVDLVCELAAGDPTIGDIIDEAPWLFFGDEAAMEYLGRVAQHRAGRR